MRRPAVMILAALALAIGVAVASPVTAGAATTWPSTTAEHAHALGAPVAAPGAVMASVDGSCRAAALWAAGEVGSVANVSSADCGGLKEVFWQECINGGDCTMYMCCNWGVCPVGAVQPSAGGSKT